MALESVWCCTVVGICNEAGVARSVNPLEGPNMGKRKMWQMIAAVIALGMIAAACGESGEGGAGDTAAPSTAADTTAAVDLVQGTESLLVTIQNRGSLKCGIGGTAVAFSETQADGSVIGFDADYCRALAAAITGDADNVEFVALTASQRFTSLAAGDVDLLIRNTTWTQSRDTDLAGDFGPTTYYDGQQLMGRASDGFNADSAVSDIDGAIVCTSAGTTTEKNVAEAAALEGGGFSGIDLQTFEEFNDATEAFISGACDILTTDGSALVGRKAQQQPADQDWVIFPATPISKEPLGPMYRQNDSAFADVVNWTVYATIIADEKGVTSANIDEMNDPDVDPELGRLFGSGDDEIQTKMGLDATAFYNVISQVGNYDEIYTRNLVPVGLVRAGSANARWTEGGLIYAPPAR